MVPLRQQQELCQKMLNYPAQCRQYLPPYSPELNLIEILWRRIKYTWLPFSAYACLNALSEA